MQHKVKIYLNSGQVAEITTQADITGIGVITILEQVPEVRSFKPDEVSLVTVERMEET